MLFFDIHTHNKDSDRDVISIYNLSPQDIKNGITSSDSSHFFSVGIHPWDISTPNEINIDYLKEILAQKNIVAIGECGLDKLTEAPMNKQIEVFCQQIALSEEYALPMIIHCVKAWDELIALHKKFSPKQKWIIHGFRGKEKQAEQLIQLGFALSIGEHYNKDILKSIYPNHLFIETDTSSVDIKRIYETVATNLEINTSRLSEDIKQNVSSTFKLTEINPSIMIK